MSSPKIEFAKGRLYDLPIAPEVSWKEPYKRPPFEGNIQLFKLDAFHCVTSRLPSRVGHLQNEISCSYGGISGWKTNVIWKAITGGEIYSDPYVGAYADVTSVSPESEGKPDGIPDILFRTSDDKTYVFPGVKSKK